VAWKSSIILVWAIAQVLAQDKPLPKFEDFKVTEVFKGPLAAPNLRTPGQRMFRTRIREGAKGGPNFAGHYAIAEWGCGSSCISIAVVDEKTGAVYDGPFVILGYIPVHVYPDVPTVDSIDQLGVKFKLDSRLLIVRGCAEDEDCASFYYEWTGSKFELLRKLPAVPRKP
jgi:hypothetical protein